MLKYSDLPRKDKQLLALEYPYKTNDKLFAQNSNRIIAGSNLEELKEEMAQEDVSLIKRSEFLSNKPDDFSKRTSISILSSVMGGFDEETYRNSLELAQRDLDPARAAKELYIIQAQRLAMGLAYEQEVGLGNNPETENCMRGLESIVKTYNDIVNGRKHDITVNHSISQMIDDLDIEDDLFSDIGDQTYDYDTD